MNIDPPAISDLSSSRSRTGIESSKSDGARSKAAPEQLATALSSSVRKNLASIPEIRPEVVERGRRLLADPNYPSCEIANAIARRLSGLPEDEAHITD